MNSNNQYSLKSLMVCVCVWGFDTPSFPLFTTMREVGLKWKEQSIFNFIFKSAFFRKKYKNTFHF
jgi:hypothetical protein